MNNQHISREKIIQNKEIAKGVFLLTFERKFNFKAGQIIGIGMNENDSRRLYSIASGEHEQLVKILYNVVDEGYMTPKLSDLEEDDNIWVTEPRGEFLYSEDPAYWICTGTGIAPFYSMISSGQFKNKVLIHGERDADKFYFRKELEEKLGANFVKCSSREQIDDAFEGRVTEYLQNEKNLPTDRKYYLCGRAEMVVEVRDILIARGVPFNQILSEIYF